MSQGGGRVPITVLKLSFPSFEETPTLALRTGRMGDQVTPPARQRAELRELRTRGEGHTEKNIFFIAEMKKNKIETMRQLR